MLSIWELQSRRAFVYQLDRKASIANSYSERRHQIVIGFEALLLYFWFGSGFIYARLNLNQYIGLGKKEQRPYYFLFLSCGLNT